MSQLLDSSGDLVIFTAVVDRGSITAAAESLDMAPSSVSRALTRLEEKVGGRLIRRTTRRLDLTPEGEQFHGRILRVLADLEDAENELRQAAGDVRGRLRVSVAVPFAIHQLIPRLQRFRSLYPRLHVDLIMSDALSDLIEERADVAIRIAPLADSSLFSRRLASCKRILVASKGYVEQRGMPKTVDDLRQGHEAVLFSGFPSLNTWQFDTPKEGRQSVLLEGSMSANNGEGVLALVEAGHGIALLSSFLVYRGLQEGRLVKVLQEEPVQAEQIISAVYTERVSQSARLKAFLDFLSAEFTGKWEAI